MQISQKTARWIRIAGVVVVVGGSVALWKLSGSSEPQELADDARPFLYSAATPIIVFAAYIFGAGIAFFPILPMIIATGIVFDPWMALLYSGVGSILASLTGYFLGRWMGPSAVEMLGGKKMRELGDQLAQSGLTGMIALRLVPIAPFSLVGMAAGACRVRFLNYLVGSAIGLAPGVAIFSFLGHQLTSGGNLWLTLATAAAALILGSFGWLRARKKQREEKKGREPKAARSTHAEPAA